MHGTGITPDFGTLLLWRLSPGLKSIFDRAYVMSQTENQKPQDIFTSIGILLLINYAHNVLVNSISRF